MDTFWEYFSVLAPSVGLGLIFWLVMRSLFRADTGERNARAELEEREATEWARLRDERGPGGPGAEGALESGEARGAGPEGTDGAAGGTRDDADGAAADRAQDDRGAGPATAS